MLFDKLTPLLPICIPVVGSLVFFLVEIRAADHAFLQRDMLYLEFSELKKHPNGQVSQAFIVHLPEGGTPAATVLYMENQDPVVYTEPIVNGTFTIRMSQYSRIRLFVLAGKKDALYLAHTHLVLFGKSGTTAHRTPASPSLADRLASLPRISLESAEQYYWHQTGVPLGFTIKNAGIPDPGLTVFENGRITPLVPDSPDPHRFTYTPPHDERLKKAGYAAARHDIVFTRFSLGRHRYHLSYVLHLHRSRYAHDNHRAGAAVLGAGLFGFTVLVLYKRRKRQWWNA